MKPKCGFWKCGTYVGFFLAVLFVVCFAWFYIRGGSSEIKELHNNLFVLSFFGWSGMNAASFFFGLVQSFIWGYIATGLWYLVGCCWKTEG